MKRATSSRCALTVLRALVLCFGLGLAPAFAQTPGSAQEALNAALALLGDQAVETANIETLKAVRNALDQLVENFADSDIAVQILLQESIDGLDIAALDLRLSGGDIGSSVTGASVVTADPDSPAPDGAAPTTDPDKVTADAPAADALDTATPPSAEKEPDDLVAALIGQAETAMRAVPKESGAARLNALLAVQAILGSITEKFPASDASVAIALGEKLGEVDPTALGAAIETEIVAMQASGAEAAQTLDEVDPAAEAPTPRDPLLATVESCLAASNLPAAPADASTIRLRVVTGADGAIQGMPELLDPVNPAEAERQLFNRTMLGLAGCRNFAAVQQDSELEIEITAIGAVAGTVLRTLTVPRSDKEEEDAQVTSATIPASLADLAAALNHCYRAGTGKSSPATAKLAFSIGPDGLINVPPMATETGLQDFESQKVLTAASLAVSNCGTFPAANRNQYLTATFSDQAVVELGIISSSQMPWPRADASTEAALNLDRRGIAEIQGRLTAIGLDPKGIDGAIGRGTRSAITSWQGSSNIPATGYLDQYELAKLRQESESSYQVWLNDGGQALVDRAAVPNPKKANTKGWYKDKRGLYCKRIAIGTWCQQNYPRELL